MEWISVNDRLPECDRPVLMWLDVVHDYMLPVIGCYNQYGEWEPASEEDWCGVLLRVTHWMPLPEPPKTE